MNVADMFRKVGAAEPCDCIRCRFVQSIAVLVATLDTLTHLGQTAPAERLLWSACTPRTWCMVGALNMRLTEDTSAGAVALRWPRMCPAFRVLQNEFGPLEQLPEGTQFRAALEGFYAAWKTTDGLCQEVRASLKDVIGDAVMGAL